MSYEKLISYNKTNQMH